MQTMGVFERVLMIVGAVAGVLGCVFVGVQFYKFYLWKRRVTWDDALQVGDDLLKQLEASTWKPDLVIGLGRSGGIWGGWIAGNLGSLPFALVDAKKEPPIEFPGGADILAALHRTYGDKKRVLLIEGATSRGAVFREFFNNFGAALTEWGWDLKKAVLYRNLASDAELEFVGREDLVPWPTDPRPFPWHRRAGYRPFLGNIVGRGRYQQSPDFSS